MRKILNQPTPNESVEELDGVFGAIGHGAKIAIGLTLAVFGLSVFLLEEIEERLARLGCSWRL